MTWTTDTQTHHMNHGAEVGVRPSSPTPSPYLVEGHVLVGPELVVPDLCLLPQPSQPLLQGRLLGGDVVRDWPDV